MNWKPTPKQSEFLSAPEQEVLFGGGAGGGKTDALVVDALGAWQEAALNPRYRALIVRRTFPELRDVIDRSRVIYPVAVPGAIYNESAKEWRFPSGAKVVFGYAERDADRFQFQGQEYTYIGMEELTQWPTDRIYTYLWSRLRTSDPKLKCLFRATCNPGGVGHKWVQDRWEILPDGKPTRFAVRQTLEDDDGMTHVRVIWRRFIPSLVTDNPHLGLDYRANLQQLSEVEQAALLRGRWDAVEIPGQIYEKELRQAFDEDRIRNVPYEPTLPVHTAWDLGVSDATSIVFFQQARGSGEIRVIDYYEASGEGLPHYAQVLQQRGYVYGTHWGPHDMRVRELGSGVSRIDTAKSLGIKFEIVPNIGFDDGLNGAKLIFPRVWFDKTKAARLVDALRHYRKDFNNALGEFKPTPVHDWASHGADAFRYMAVANDSIKEKKKARAPSHNSFGGWVG